MTAMHHVLRSAVLGLLCLGAAANAAPPAATHSFIIEPKSLNVALTEFARQSGLQVVFEAEIGRNLDSKGVKGGFTAEDALKRLLANTPFEYAFINERTVAIRPARKESAQATGQQMRVALTDAADTTSNGSKSSSAAPDEGEIEVTSTRIDGINNKGIIDTGAEAPIYHSVIDRETINRLGITSAEELFRFIPQTSTPFQALQVGPQFVNSAGNLLDTPSRVSLRGFDSTQTVVLINGRALPRTGYFRNAGPDLSRIPVAAIERVEILPASASAIYGSGAIGGGINIILRKNYQGQDLTAYFGTSYEGGAEEYRLTYLGGKSFNSGRTVTTFTVDYQTRGQMLSSQRDFVDRARERYPQGTTTMLSGRNAFEQLVLPTFAGPRAILLMDAPTGDLGIPGAPGARFATVPVGTSPAQSLLLTPASFSGSANQLFPGNKFGNISLYNPQDNYTVDLQLEHTISPRLTVYANLTGRFLESDYTYVQPISAAGGNITLAANDPLNPFRNDVTPGFIGRAVRVYLDPADLPVSHNYSERRSGRLTLGVKGSLTPKWEWSLDATGDSNKTTNKGENVFTYFDYLQFSNEFLLAVGVPNAAPAAQRRALYPLLADREAFPFTGDPNEYFNQIGFREGRTENFDAIGRVSGELFNLPAGPLRVSMRANYTNMTMKSGQRTEVANQAFTLLGLAQSDDPPGITLQAQNRSTKALAVETNIPVIGRRWRPIPIEALDLTFGATRDWVKTTGNTPGFAVPTNSEESSNTTVAGLKLQFIRDVALRVSYSEGVYPPGWDEITGTETSRTSTTTARDAARGNTVQPSSFLLLSGVNLGLRPEQSESTNLGLILKPRFLQGLTFTVDAWETRKIDGIGTVSITQALARPDLYGGLITRGGNLPGDQPGWAGVVTQFNGRRQNIGIQKTDGVDVGIRYDISMGDAGNFYLNTNASFTNSFRTQPVENGPVINTVGGSGPVRWRGYSSLTWSRGPVELTLTANHVGERSTNLTAPSDSFPNAAGLDGYRMPAFTLWDTQFNYETASSAAATGLPAIFGGIKWTVGIQNLFNQEPAFTSDGSYFYNNYQDPRMRYMYLTLRKSF